MSVTRFVRGVLLVSNLMIFFGSLAFITLLVAVGLSPPTSYTAPVFAWSFISFVVGLLLHTGAAITLDFLKGDGV